MRRISFSFFICILVALGAVAAFAAKSVTTPAVLGEGNTRVAVDESAGTIRILIDGRPVVIIDKDGLHVRENISYGGSLIDFGAVGFDQRAGESGHGQ